MRIATKTVYVAFIIWPLKNLEKSITTVTKKPKNSFKTIASTFESNLKILKVSNWMSFLNWKNSLKFNCLPCF